MYLFIILSFKCDAIGLKILEKEKNKEAREISFHSQTKKCSQSLYQVG